VLTLFLTPVVYLYFERFQEWSRGARTERRGSQATVAVP